MLKRIVAIMLIYICTCIGWAILGGSVEYRTTTQHTKLRGSVGQLWGTIQRQTAPTSYYEVLLQERVQESEVKTDTGIETRYKVAMKTKKINMPINKSRIDTSISLGHRKKGLLWYSTYKVKFKGDYYLLNDTIQLQELFFKFTFPSKDAVYDNVIFVVGDKEKEGYEINNGSIDWSVRLEPGQEQKISIYYESFGLDQWWYDFGTNVNKVKDFSLKMHTDFDKIDFPENSISPTFKKQLSNGWDLEWQYKNLFSGVNIGISMPEKLNPGPWVSKVTFSAPISLFLFFFVLLIITIIKEVNVHPMNYFFIGAAYFSFHLLLAYLVDHISIHAAFIISSAVSIFLVISYMRLVVGMKFALIGIGIAQFVYLVLFSYTYFFEGFTGLAVTILCICTLFLIMQITGRINWEKALLSEAQKG
ncbi:MAG: hypothetical protein A2Y62_20910 [Candidatus Fischerbacteria bacterium RBG_13_37_8]|uniref:Cell envelope integrity protein CreD n=1 Tax=Candidatus Fischerbacteria bacterium RBG_13_37_8 TaxID=1817863 RepID=A0A1F5VGD2_9BACT|nr:MAG: hypothetical protein A2Y62_20910 [Candidatus Fischerbacteria bacterium RBG_13_37_8]